VITTVNPGSVLSGATAIGEIVPIRSAQAIAHALRRRRQLGPNARPDRSSMPPISLKDYRDRLLQAVETDAANLNAA
jgi:hypothetical protein